MFHYRPSKHDEIPISINGPHFSSCCKKTTRLVRSMDGGFITANCSNCNKPSNLSYDFFLDLQLNIKCPRCSVSMKKFPDGKYRNFAYKCESCQLFSRLSDWLPGWED